MVFCLCRDFSIDRFPKDEVISLKICVSPRSYGWCVSVSNVFVCYFVRYIHNYFLHPFVKCVIIIEIVNAMCTISENKRKNRIELDVTREWTKHRRRKDKWAENEVLWYISFNISSIANDNTIHVNCLGSLFFLFPHCTVIHVIQLCQLKEFNGQVVILHRSITIASEIQNCWHLWKIYNEM